MCGVVDGFEGDAQHLAGRVHEFVAGAVETFDQHPDAVGMDGIDRPSASVGADTFAERTVSRADHRDTGRERFAHHDPERFRVRAGQQHHLDAGSMQQLGQQLVVVGAVRVQFG